MTSKGTFSLNRNMMLHTNLDGGVVLQIERVGPTIARVFFTKDGVEVPVPVRFAITDITNGNVNVEKNVGREEFMLCDTDSYLLICNDLAIIKLTAERQWNVQSPFNRKVYID
jgi:hypothetical protein